MLFTARQLRTAIRSPRAAIKLVASDRRQRLAAGQPRSPQRPTFEAALRRHTDSGRADGAMLAEYDLRWARAKRRETAAAAFETGRRMAARFVSLDGSAPDPVRVLEAPADRPVLGHSLRLGHDLLYKTPEGLILRQLLTDGEITRSDHLRLYALACLLHFEAPGGREPARVDVWQLRFRKEFSWPRWLLLRQTAALGERLDEVARAFTENVA